MKNKKVNEAGKPALEHTKVVCCCGKCGATNVRIYRPYGCFYRSEDNRCNDCLPEEFEKRGWFVP